MQVDWSSNSNALQYTTVTILCLSECFLSVDVSDDQEDNYILDNYILML